MSKKQKTMKEDSSNQQDLVEDIEGIVNENTAPEEAQENDGDDAPTDEVALLRQEIDELKAHIEELKDKNLRQAAEFQNFRNRMNREKLELIGTAAKDTLSGLLPVLDDFDRAKKNADDENSQEQFSEGVNLVYQKLHGVLKAKGLKAMETDGVDFDPDLHEALTEIPAPTEDMKGKVVDTIEKGYTLNDKIIRHAKVVVGK